MADVTICGVPVSSYVRVVRLACEEKGVSYDIEPLAPGSDEINALHPHGKVPCFRHGDFALYETSAIVRYIDEAFGGPALQPKDPKARANMNKWISAINDVYDQTMIREIVIQRLVVPQRGGTPNEEMISTAAGRLDNQLGAADKTLAEHDYLAGGEPTLADLFLVPIIFYLGMAPEGQAVLPKYPALGAWMERMKARPSYEASAPSAKDLAA